jgi:hypothetical protein
MEPHSNGESEHGSNHLQYLSRIQARLAYVPLFLWRSFVLSNTRRTTPEDHQKERQQKNPEEANPEGQKNTSVSPPLRIGDPSCPH